MSEFYKLILLSDEFISTATREIHGYLEKITEVINHDTDHIESDSVLEVKQSLHNIKGLAPMMGKEQVGTLASLLDLLLKKSLEEDVEINDIFTHILLGANMMKRTMSDNTDLQQFISEISKKYARFLS